jgi:predicted MFS family arabinose efflux permease
MVGLLVGVPAGQLADLREPRNMPVVLSASEAIAAALYVLVGDFTSFLVVVVLAVTIERAKVSVLGTLIAGVGEPGGRARLRAFIRLVNNLGQTLGAPVGGIALAIDTYAGYASVILIDAATFAAGAAFALRVPPVAPRPHVGDGPRLTVLRDRPFVAVTVANAVLSMHFVLLDVALPLDH